MPEYFYMGEEVERSMRIYDQGFKIIALPHISVFHAVSPLNRNNAKIDRLHIRNAVLRELINAPLIFLPLALCRSLFSGIRLIGVRASLTILVEIYRSSEVRRMLLRRRQSDGFRSLYRLENNAHLSILFETIGDRVFRCIPSLRHQHVGEGSISWALSVVGSTRAEGAIWRIRLSADQGCGD